MGLIDWTILALFLVYTIWDGTRKGRETKHIEGFFLAGRSMPWWAMGLSIMATHASAITFIGTTGQAFNEDMRFVQVYLSMPFAMVILSVTLVPFYYKAKNFSAYEVLEQRFGLPTRLFTSFLFLLSRGLALGTIIAAPSYILALLLGIELRTTIIIIGAVTTFYTLFGGMDGVIRTDVKQMSIMLFAIFFSFFWIIHKLPEDIGFTESLRIAGAVDKLQAIDLSFSITEKYNVWSGLIAGLFLMLSYFGCDQTQVQRYLSARSLKDAQGSLLLSAFAKVPMQFIILLLGVLLYVFYIFQDAPMVFRTLDDPKTAEWQSPNHATYAQLKLHQIDLAREVAKGNAAYKEELKSTSASLKALRKQEMQLKSAHSGKRVNDTNYIFPFFILNEIPVGLLGLIIAAIFAAALSSIDSTLNALSTSFIVDWYRRLHSGEQSETHYLKASRWSTLFWGVLATLSAIALGETTSIIELVNQIGSYFYGAILGVFVLLLFVPSANGTGAFAGLAIGICSVFLFDGLYFNSATESYQWIVPAIFSPVDTSIMKKSIEFLWLNPVGTLATVGFGWLISRLNTPR